MEERRKIRNQITPEKTMGHFRTITEHKVQVMKHCFAIGLYYQGLMHDLSKYTPSEFLMGCKYYQEGKRSPNNGEREDKGYSFAWMHHKGRNRHHFEFWTDYSLNPRESKQPIVAVQMPRNYVAEMLMDRIAASKIYLKEDYDRHEPLKYFQRGKSHYLMHPQTCRELERMLKILDKRGEADLFRFVRDYYLKGYPM
ncbi:MAG: DUF5662 family protein [Lachnospiraceae bacterium]|nr:DUF5662 family protein [Lachnospiraceae bacterium]